MKRESASFPPVLILGSGIAGLTAALKFAEWSDVKILSKENPMEGSTRYAQGGIASVWSKGDSFAEHIKDTLDAGGGLCNEKIVEICVKEGPERVRELIELGVPFTKRHSKKDTLSKDPAEAFDLHKEGGHRQRRILHADDLTGLAIETTLFERAKKHKRIQFLEHFTAIDLITEEKTKKKNSKAARVLGAYVLNEKTKKIETLRADITILATGGAGKVYLYTTNPDVSTGDGIAMAYRAGARVANLEFTQFHPTCFFHPGTKTFLISEALRGEGAILKNRKGEEFMNRYHEMKSLAPRDIVARAIDKEMKRTGDTHVWLDATHLKASQLKENFPNIYKFCLDHSVDITRAMIPVVPAAHYMCGGVWVDEMGRSSIPGLYAIGEAACTGLHGANRLASNSLLEACVFAHRTAISGREELSHHFARGKKAEKLPEWRAGNAVEIEEQLDIAVNWREVRSIMWNYVGIVRSNRRLERARRRLDLIAEEVNRMYWEFLLTRDLIELRNLVTVASLIVKSAELRKESRGLHYTVDYPELNNDYFLKDTVL